MTHHKFKTIALVSLAILMLAPLAPAVPPLDVTPQEGMLLLKNGRVIEGKITRDGERYYVALPNGEIRIKAENVEVVCHGLDECYRHRRKRLEPSNITHHLELAQWCVQRGLLGYAAQELATAIEINPRHPRIALLERRLFLARQEPKPAAPSTTASGEPSVSTAQLDRLVRSLPRHSVEQFTNSIQPLLQNSCSAAACHGPQSTSKYRLQRISNGRIASQRVTQRNLQATLEMILRDAPGESPLLTEPVKPHGTAKGPVFTAREVGRYKQLVDWVYQISQYSGAGVVKEASKPAVPATIGAEQPPLLQPAPGAASTPPHSSTEKHDAATLNGLSVETIRQPEVQRGAKPGGYVPRDPFDPEIFNLRHFPNRRPPT